MEPHRQPSGRRTLLPAEIELCEAVGLSEAEYWYFVDATEAYNGERSKEYAHIPDIVNDPTGGILTAIVIGLVLTAVSTLLAPKPKSPKSKEDNRPSDLTLGGSEGKSSFGQVDGFQSTQDLARLGQTIPLVFAKHNAQLKTGGIRVNAQLMWSQMITLASGQQLRGVFSFSDGQTEGVPDYGGLAIGDTLLQGYTAQKVSAYWRQNGGRLIEPTNRIPGSRGPILPYADAFGTFWDGSQQIESFFSGAIFTNVQSQFGAFAPMFNNTAYIPQPELVLIPDEANKDFKKDLKKKKKLMNDRELDFSQRSFFRTIVTGTGAAVTGYSGYIGPDHQISFRNTVGSERVDDPEYRPHQLGFINSATESARSAADSNIALGDLYLVGDTALATCTEILGSFSPTEPWAPDINTALTGNDKTYWFYLSTGGFVDTIPSSESEAVRNPKEPWNSYALQRAAVATFTNTRPCEATELIIKSTVWRQVSGFTDVKAWPSDELVDDYEENNGSIQIGTVTKYLKRQSFFMLEVRPAGTATWIDITGSKFFYVEGNNPVAQYHYIRVDTAGQGNVETEFRLRPVAGIGVLRRPNQPMRKLQYGNETRYASNGYQVVFNGRDVVFNEAEATNPEFIRPAQTSTDEGGLENAGISPTEAGTFLNYTVPKWVDKGERLVSSPRNYVSKYLSLVDPNFGSRWEYWWDSYPIAGGSSPSQVPEPPQPVYDPRTSNVRYFWRAVPGDNLSNQYPYLVAYRYIRREDKEATLINNGEPWDAALVPAVNVQVANENAKGLVFYVRRWVNAYGTGVGYKWTINPGQQGENYSPGDVLEVQWSDGTPIQNTVVTGTINVIVNDTDAKNYARYDAAIDVVTFEAQNASNASSPEHELVAVNEKVAQFTPTYENMTIGGLRINSSTEWSNFDSFSAYMQKGIILENLIDGSAKASNLLPDIVFGMMTNPDWGAGTVLGAQQVDKYTMSVASHFCFVNGFTWDGVVDDRISFREWVYQNAQYCLLDATVVGGRFALTPAVPYTSNFSIGNSMKPEIKALFTDGNMRDMKVEFLSPEDRQIFRAEILYRQETLNGFAKVRQFTMRLADSEGGSDKDPIETFDMSGFCTSPMHAARFGYYALLVRKHVDHAITFQTTPQAAMNLSPGQYFKVASNSTHTSRFNNGSVDDQGWVTSVEDMPNGSYSIYYWEPGTEGVREGSINISDGKTTDPAFYNTVFTIVTTDAQSRVYKLESLTYGDEGLIEVTGSYMPLTDIGSLKILDWNPNDFVAEGFEL